MNMRDMPLEYLRQVGLWAHLISKTDIERGFSWRCYEEAPGGTWTDLVLHEGDNAYSLNQWMPPRFPWVVPLKSIGSSFIISQTRVKLAQIVVKEHGGSYAWRAVAPKTDSLGNLQISETGPLLEDAEDMPHSGAFEPNGFEPPRLPWNVFLSPRFVPNEHMFYLGGC
jgi:hypothetical protein